ncbi:MAG: dockerin type I repeat-containing protein, partial [Clostridia bacterium]|nr:dockerin type I repeat-containing protein [Clostridia bacterium]
SRDDQGYNNQWGIGHHTATYTVLGKSCEFDIEIKAYPVEVTKLEIEDVTIVDGIDSWIDSEYNQATGDWDLHWTRYEYRPLIKVTLKDGSVEEGSGAFFFDDQPYWVEFDDGQGYGHEWSAGPHCVTARFMGAECTFTVTVTECPIKDVEFDPIYLRYNTDGYFVGEGDDRFFYYEYFPEFTVYLADGTPVRSEAGNVEVDGRNYGVRSDDDQDKEHWDVGENPLRLTVAGITKNVVAIVGSSDIESVEISGLWDLTVTINYNEDAGGGSETFRVIGFDAKTETSSSYGGVLRTDKGDFAATLNFDEPVDGVMNIDRGVSISLGEFTSNTLDVNYWGKTAYLEGMASLMFSCYKALYDAFDGISADDYDPDEAAGFAYGLFVEDSVGLLKVVGDKICIELPAATVKRAVEYAFGIKDFDVSELSMYDPQTPDTVLLDYNDFMAGLEIDHDARLTDDGWECVVTGEVLGDNVITITLDGNGAMSVAISEGEEEFLPGDVDGDGVLTMKDVLKIRKNIAGLEELSDEEIKRADIDGDTQLTMKDVLKIRRTIAGLE